jgi:hypothetical protein
MNIGSGLIPVGLSLLSVLDTQPARPVAPAFGLSEDAFVFRAVGSETVKHTFYYTNWTAETLQVTNATVSEPIILEYVTPSVRPGEVGKVSIILGEPRINGDYDGEVRLGFRNHTASNLIYGVTGRFVPALELSPLPAFFVTAQRGTEKTASIEIHNRTTSPIKVFNPQCDSKRFDVKLTTIAEGEFYILTLRLKPDAAPGRVSEMITLGTSNPERPVLRVAANTMVREHVYAFPDSIDFGQIDLKDVRANAHIAQLLAQTLMVYQSEGTNFEARIESSLPFLNVSMERAATRDRYQLRVNVDPKQFVSGRFDGVVRLQTNDKQISQLDIPVRGLVIDSEAF